MFVQFAYSARRRAFALVGIVICMAFTGCSTSYSVPGKPADFKALGVTRESLTDTGINQTLARQPLATFPCAIAAVRIQAPGYRSDTAETFGTGNFCVFVRNIEACHAELAAQGVRFRSDGPVEMREGPNTGGKSLYGIDPDGYIFEFHERPPRVAS